MTGMNRKPVCLFIRNFAYNFAAECGKGISFFKMRGGGWRAGRNGTQLVGHNDIQTQETRICKKAFGHFFMYALQFRLRQSPHALPTFYTVFIRI
jgi:hypothetical protein